MISLQTLIVAVVSFLLGMAVAMIFFGAMLRSRKVVAAEVMTQIAGYSKMVSAKTQAEADVAGEMMKPVEKRRAS